MYISVFASVRASPRACVTRRMDFQYRFKGNESERSLFAKWIRGASVTRRVTRYTTRAYTPGLVLTTAIVTQQSGSRLLLRQIVAENNTARKKDPLARYVSRLRCKSDARVCVLSTRLEAQLSRKTPQSSATAGGKCDGASVIFGCARGRGAKDGCSDKSRNALSSPPRAFVSATTNIASTLLRVPHLRDKIRGHGANLIAPARPFLPSPPLRVLRSHYRRTIRNARAATKVNTVALVRVCVRAREGEENCERV